MSASRVTAECNLIHLAIYIRGVAQPGSALVWGASGRRFKSGRPDHHSIISQFKTRKVSWKKSG